MSGRDVSRLGVVEAVVREHGVKAFEHLRRIGEIEPSLRQRLLALGFIEGDLHLDCVPPINHAVNIWRYKKYRATVGFGAPAIVTYVPRR